MSRLVWHKTEDRVYQTGVDRGVLYPSSNNPVPWNGLISVTEKGSQTATTYYRDGIAYLTTVTPREYSAQISAYTFPDEFSEIVGIVEAADGLYFDSQVPDQFDLSYRTMYADGEAYRIHIVYGATAVLSDVSFSSVGDNVDASTFEFDITCTPQTISGYRPMGHVIIDSRRLEPGVLTNIENLLYGSFGVEPHIPPIETLVEMMSFGDEVIVTDNGDGTWTAEGSYENVQTKSDGTFIINNVSYLNLGDGVYAFASTGEDIYPELDSISEPLGETI